MRVVTTVRPACLLAAAILSSSFGASAWQVPAASWLDRPLTGWNTAGRTVPKAPAAKADKAQLIARCGLKQARTAPEKALATAGWIVFWIFDQDLVLDGVEVVGGMSGADPMCRPVNYNLFVFVDGRFAGTLSPTAMMSRLDGDFGGLLPPVRQLTASFVRSRRRIRLLPIVSGDRSLSHRSPAGGTGGRAGGCQDHASTVGQPRRVGRARRPGSFPRGRDHQDEFSVPLSMRLARNRASSCARLSTSLR